MAAGRALHALEREEKNDAAALDLGGSRRLSHPPSVTARDGDACSPREVAEDPVFPSCEACAGLAATGGWGSCRALTACFVNITRKVRAASCACSGRESSWQS